jgi:hypothetical protein
MSLQTVALISDAANWVLLISLITGMISTVLIMWTANIKDHGWLAVRQTTQQTIFKLGAAVDEANARLTSANAALAEADARASAAASEALEAKARAAQAEAALTLSNYKSGHVLAREQEQRVVEKLLAMPPAIYDARASHDPDSLAVMMQIGNMLKAAQWRVRDVPAGTGPGLSGKAELPEGITIEIADSRRVDWEATVISLVLALREEGVHAAGQASPDADPSAIHVIIGGKAETGTTYGQGAQRSSGRE